MVGNNEEIFSSIKYDIKLEMQGLKHMGIDITSESLEKYIENQCNLATCHYNKSDKCTNEEKRKECVEVSRKVLCLEDEENEFKN